MLKGIHFLLTYQCLYECDHCFLYCGPRMSGTFTIEQVEEALRQGVDAGIEEIRSRYGSDLTFLFPRLWNAIRRRLGLAPLSSRAAVLAGLMGVGIRLALALVVTALTGQWTGIPWATGQ